jgi:predicted acetyltransferase
MEVEIHPVPAEHKHVLRNIMQLYLYEFSVYDGQELDERGLYTYPYMEEYWEEPKRHPFLIRVDGKIAGFALVTVDDDAQEAHMSEFFVVRKHRRRGVGEMAARLVFARFPGRWIVTQLEENVPAQQFWRAVIHRYTDGNFKDIHLPERRRVVQEFLVEPT